jgi:hypothetical protein
MHTVEERRDSLRMMEDGSMRAAGERQDVRYGMHAQACILRESAGWRTGRMLEPAYGGESVTEGRDACLGIHITGERPVGEDGGRDAYSSLCTAGRAAGRNGGTGCMLEHAYGGRAAGRDRWMACMLRHAYQGRAPSRRT